MQDACQQCGNGKPILLEACIELRKSVQNGQYVIKAGAILVFKSSEDPCLQCVRVTWLSSYLLWCVLPHVG